MPSFSPGAADGIDVVAQAESRQAAARDASGVRARSIAWIRGATVVRSAPNACTTASVEPMRDTVGRKRKSLIRAYSCLLSTGCSRARRLAVWCWETGPFRERPKPLGDIWGKPALALQFGIFDHVAGNGTPLADLFETRLKLVEQYDRSGFRSYHIARPLLCRR